jgi:hypothetical protein
VIDFTGEPGGTRTRDPVIKSHMLYQLSYRPSEGNRQDLSILTNPATAFSYPAELLIADDSKTAAESLAGRAAM